MHFTKPAWVAHKDAAKSDANAKRLSIFSVHVHPDGSRIATGGLDAKIRIWSTKPILNPASELSNKPPKSLCTLTMHTGPVLVVRWAHSGRWLASGSDDEIVMIWDLDPNARGKVWGSDEVNVEGWKPLKRLPGHESDVTDVAWSPGDRYLASVGLDSQVIIWCGYTLERIRKLDQHQGFVKGVCWDPVGEFLATQSDDRSVKIWRTTDWSLEAEVTKPFEDSPGSTFFRRLSWSPDGAHITASNATNNKGFVFVAAVITRNTWTSEISLVGHENTVEVATYNPHIFLRNMNAPVATANICSVVALGADDRSVSVWQTKSARPIIVVKEVFDRQIMDLSWSWDGLTLYAASSDGTIAAFNFEPEELEGIAPHSAQEQYLTKFGFTPPPVPEGYSHVDTKETSQVTPAKATQEQAQPAVFSQVNGGGEKINMLVAKRSNKKRANLTTQVGNVPSAGTSAAVNGIASPTAAVAKRAPLTQVRDVPLTSVRAKSPTAFPLPSEQPFDAPDSWSRHADVKMDLDVPIDALNTSTGGKRKASAVIDLTDEGGRPPKARTLGGDRVREPVPVKEIAMAEAGTVLWAGQAGPSLPVPAVLTLLTADVEGTDDVLEVRNPEDDGPTEVMFVSGKQTQWLDYLPSPALAIKATSYFCAVALLDGSVVVYSHTGRRLIPSLTLGAPCSYMDATKHALLILTSTGQLYSWNIRKQSSFFPPVPISPLLSSPNHTVVSVTVRPNGVPLINTSNGVSYSYDPTLLTWVKVADRWWAEGSEVWQGRQRQANNQTAGRGIMSSVEGSIGVTAEETPPDKQRPAWWNTALTLGHLETRLNASRLLDSPQEYKQALLVYAKRIADEGFRAKAEELIKELFGPVYFRPGREDSWSPSVIGLSKRDLLKDVLSIFARSKTLTKLAMDWQDTLKKASNDE
ncbi:putative required for replication-independent chromatin assembly and for the periodic repression of histone gene transcription during the cell cycle [Lyophyllum shimeji]|uniref:Protein HIR n=1 Tax=Lyophyllum shimeji TaxID=47721 RepID=A0A9P3PPK9_LYOSH|nr:putative required for replication-independent chromatin assembly and for the periodic repression of histone gene transcription during the cell cycle [Lyophyllum shimeji]